jgi:hypothetical protein
MVQDRSCAAASNPAEVGWRKDLGEAAAPPVRLTANACEAITKVRKVKLLLTVVLTDAAGNPAPES